MSEIRFDRLAQLADHLESGKLGHDKFNFGFYHETGLPCGTVGCAIGECPFIWPEDWHFDSLDWPFSAPVLRGGCAEDWGGGGGAEYSGMEWFGLQYEHQYGHLFCPMAQSPEVYGGTWLAASATRQEVAANIRAFIANRQEVSS